MVDTSRVKPTYHLVDAVQRSMSSPNFFVPTEEARMSLCRGDMVKLLFANKEKMWVLVKEVESKGRYIGELRNHPVVIDTVRYGDTIHFEARHIADISSVN